MLGHATVARRGLLAAASCLLLVLGSPAVVGWEGSASTSGGDDDGRLPPTLDRTYAPEPDGITEPRVAWTKSPGNPLLTPGPAGAWDQTAVHYVNVILEAGGFRMWYGGCTGDLCSIGYATSPDGLSWTRYPGNPVLSYVPGTWENTIGNPYVIKDGDVYRMWYAGNGPCCIQLGYATSPDGIQWARNDGPVLTPGYGWDSYTISTPVVAREGASFTMWYSGASSGLTFYMGRATSSDGRNWTRNPANPILSPAFAWEGSRVHPAQVTINAGSYEMFYTADLDYVQIGRAVSTDGVIWARSPSTPVLSPTPGTWDAGRLGDVSVVDTPQGRRLWYVGLGNSGWGIGGAWEPGSALPDASWFDLPPMVLGVLGAGVGAAVGAGFGFLAQWLRRRRK